MTSAAEPTVAPLDFFISYSPADERWATWIAGTLEAAGYRTMLQAWDFIAGTNFIHQMDRGLTESAVVIAVLSRHYLQSRYGRLEWQAALRQAPERPQTRLITVRVEDIEPEGLLAQITYVDLVGLDDAEQAKTLLLRRVRDSLAGRARPDVPPPYPAAQAGAVMPHVEPRRLPAVAPVYPSAPAQVSRKDISILHVAVPAFGAARSRQVDVNSVYAHVTHMIGEGAPEPDLLLVSGDLTASATPAQFERAHEFLARLRAQLQLATDRVLLVPGALDVNKHLCRAYFEQCAGNDVKPEPPFWPKWTHFAKLFREFYLGVDGYSFESGQPWSLFALPELRVVVAGLNSTIAVTHLDEHQHQIGKAQAAWFAQRLREYQDRGWLRIGVARHGPGTGEMALKDTQTFNRLVAPRLNLLLLGPQADRSAGAVLPVATMPEGGHCELVVVTRDGLTRWGDEPDSGAPASTTIAWSDAHSTLNVQDDDELPDEQSPAEPLDLDNPTRQLLRRIEEVCRVKYQNMRVRRVEADFPYLIVHYQDDVVVRELWVAAEPTTPTAADLEKYQRIARSADASVSFELVYQGDQLAPELRDPAVTGLKLRSFTEFQGLLDLDFYVAGQTRRLEEDPNYPAGLYVPQGFSADTHGEVSKGDDLVAELLNQVSSDHGRFILLLADFGRGKTFALRELARRLAKEEKYAHLIPIFIEMRHLDKAQRIETLVAQHLASYRESLDLEAFEYMLREGRIVLIFDGFDELVTRTSYAAAADHLDTLINAATKKAKIVVASRSQHFESREQVLGKVNTLSQLLVLNVEEFTNQQIRTYLTNYYGDPYEAEARYKLISGVENLISLAHNPRMLGFVAALPQQRLNLVANELSSKAKLYDEILHEWMRYENKRVNSIPGNEGGLDTERLWRAVTSLALRLWETGAPALQLGDLADAAATVLANLDMTTEQAAFAIGSGSLLVRSDDGLFGFIHESVKEFLVAKHLAEQMDRGETTLLARHELTQLSVEFLCDLADNERCRQWVASIERIGNAGLPAQRNATRIARRLRTPHRGSLRNANLRGEDLSDRDLAGVDLAFADLSEARLNRANLERANLKGARLIETHMEGASLQRADLSDANLSRARLIGVDLTHAGIDNSTWHRTAVIAAKGIAALSTTPEMRGAAVAPGMPVQTQLAPPTLGVSYGFEIKFGRLPQPLAYNEQNDLLAVGCDNGSVVICDVLENRPLRALRGHRGRVYAVMAVPGNRLVTAGSDCTVRAWNILTGEQLWKVDGLHQWVWPVVVSNRGRLVAVSDNTGVVRMLDCDTGELRYALEGPTAPVWSGAFRPDDAQFACASADGAARLWNAQTGRPEGILSGHDGDVFRLVYSPDGGMLATADRGGTVQLWDPRRHTELFRLSAHQASVYTLSFQPGGNLLASGDTRGAIHLWDVATGAGVTSLDGHRDGIYQVLFSPDGSMLVSGDSSGKTRLWRIDRTSTPLAQLRHELNGHTSAVWPGVFSSDSKQLATSSLDQSVRLWSTETGRSEVPLRGHGRKIVSLSFDLSGTRLAACGNDGVVRLWDTITGVEKGKLSGVSDHLVSAVCSPTDGLIAAASNDGGIYLFDTHTGSTRELDVDTVRVWAQSFSPDGLVVATANDDDTVRLWYHHTGAQRYNFDEVHKGRVRSISFDSTGSELATGCDDKKVRLWDLETGECRATLEGHGNRVYSVQYSPDNSLLASASWDGTVRLWTMGANPAPLSVLEGHEGQVWAAVFHPSGELLASAGDDAIVRLWQVRTGRVVAELPSHLGRVQALAFSPDGKTLASGGEDGTVRMWDLHRAAPRLRMTLIGHAQGWAVVDGGGRYKLDGAAHHTFWHAIGGCRFEPGQLNDHLTEVTRIPLDAPF